MTIGNQIRKRLTQNPGVTPFPLPRSPLLPPDTSVLQTAPGTPPVPAPPLPTPVSPGEQPTPRPARAPRAPVSCRGRRLLSENAR